MDRRRRPPLTAIAVALVGLGAAVVANAGESALRTGELSGEPVELEVAGLAAAEADAALGAAWIELVRAGDILAAHEEAFERAAGGPVAPEPEPWKLLVRSDDICRWSGGTAGALGGRVFRLWGFGHPVSSRPTPESIAEAVASARCDRLTADPEARTMTAAAGTVVDFEPFARGWAVDRALETLRSAGAPTARVRFGPLARGYGAGPTGKGWRWEFPSLPGLVAPLQGIWLRDQAIALLRADERPLVIAGDRLARWIDLRTGSPGAGLVAVAVVTGVAADAEAVAWSMFGFGSRLGTAKAHELRPPPSVLWLVGNGTSQPLLVETSWSAVPKR